MVVVHGLLRLLTRRGKCLRRKGAHADATRGLRTCRAKSCSCSKAAERSAVIRRVSTCMKQESNRTGSSEPPWCNQRKPCRGLRAGPAELAAINPQGKSDGGDKYSRRREGKRQAKSERGGSKTMLGHSGAENDKRQRHDARRQGRDYPRDQCKAQPVDHRFSLDGLIDLGFDRRFGDLAGRTSGFPFAFERHQGALHAHVEFSK